MGRGVVDGGLVVVVVVVACVNMFEGGKQNKANYICVDRDMLLVPVGYGYNRLGRGRVGGWVLCPSVQLPS